MVGRLQVNYFIMCNTKTKNFFIIGIYCNIIIDFDLGYMNVEHNKVNYNEPFTFEIERLYLFIAFVLFLLLILYDNKLIECYF